MKYTNPEVSIIMATYNRAHFIVETLESIKDQTFDGWECLIIDDGSTDGSPQLIKKYTEADNRFQYHKRPHNHFKGLPGCRNAGLDLAKGKYIVFFDDDDIVHPENLQICVAELSNENKDYCRYLREPFTGNFKQKFEINTQYTKYYLGPENLEDIVSGKIPFNSCQIMWKKRCFEGNRFNENLMYAEEWEYYTRILTNGFRGISVNKVLFFGRKHSKSNTGEFWNNDPVRRASQIEATKLVIEILQIKGLLSKNLIRYFIQLSIFLKERSLVNFVIQKSRLGYLKKLKYRLLFDFYPVIGSGHRAKKEIKKFIYVNLLICFGTRPEAIKMAPVIQELKSSKLPFKICITAQHREMLDQVLEFFEIKPDYDLDLMKAGQSLNTLSSSIFSKIDEILDIERPYLVLVHGDTTTASIIAQAAFHRQIKVGHVEAGLRTYNKHAPFPEEINRQVIGRIADFHFAPTAQAKVNLLNENVFDEQIIVTGNTVVDSLLWADQKMNALPISIEIEKLNNLLDNSKKLILVTGHRRENFGKGLKEICEALIEISMNRQIEILYPVHLNPNVVSTVEKMLRDQDNIHLVSPVSYPTMLWLMKKSIIIISDSGGIQEEAPTFGKPVLVTRSVSERMEGIEAGYAILTGANKNRIVEETERLLQSQPDYEKRENPYGDGKAAARIVDFLIALKRSSTSLARL